MNVKNMVGIDKLKCVLKKKYEETKELLAEKKYHGQEEAKKSDFIWHFILQSFSTMGNSKGHDGLIKDEKNYSLVCYSYVANLPEEQLQSHFDSVLRKAKVRMPGKKADWLAANLKRIKNMGGVANVNALALRSRGKYKKIEFLKNFHGIGDKYARNIWMDVYDEDFRNSIAIDSRIKNITKSIGLDFSTYEEHEEFLLSLANELGLNGWELDRLMYEKYSDIAAELFIQPRLQKKSISKSSCKNQI